MDSHNTVYLEEIQVKNHLSDFQNVFKNRNSVKSDYRETIENLQDDIPRVLYYVNGEEVFKSDYSNHTTNNQRERLEAEFESIFSKVQLEIKDELKKLFNKKGFKGMSGRMTAADYNGKKEFQEQLDSKTKRYDFNIAEDGSCVTVIEHFDLSDGYGDSLPDFIGVTAFTISGNTDGATYKADYHKTIHTGAEQLDEKFISRHNIENSNGKSHDQIKDEIDRHLLDAHLVQRIPEPRHNKWERWLSGIAAIFYKVFPSDSHVPGTTTFDYKKGESLLHKHWLERERQFNKYDLHPLTMLAAFVGWPNRCKLGEDPSLTNLGWQFLGWEDNKSDAINWVLMLFSVIKNLIVILLTLPGNILRLFAEFLPLAATEACKLAVLFTDEKYETATGRTAFGYKVLNYAAQFFYHAFYNIYLIGRAITSPVESVRAAWNFKLYDSSPYRENTLKTIVNILTNILLVILSATITATAYTLLFPLVFKLIPLMGPEIAAFAAKVGNVLSPVLTYLGQNLVTFLAVRGVELAPSLAGLAIATFWGSILAAPCKRFINYCIDTWRTTEIKDTKEVEDVVVIRPDNGLSQGAKLQGALLNNPNPNPTPTIQPGIGESSEHQLLDESIGGESNRTFAGTGNAVFSNDVILEAQEEQLDKLLNDPDLDLDSHSGLEFK